MQDEWWQLKEPEEPEEEVRAARAGQGVVPLAKLVHPAMLCGRLRVGKFWQDPNAKLKAAGLYIERTQPVAAGPFASQEVIPPPGVWAGKCSARAAPQSQHVRVLDSRTSV